MRIWSGAWCRCGEVLVSEIVPLVAVVTDVYGESRVRSSVPGQVRRSVRPWS